MGGRLLIVHHTPSPAVRALLEALIAGARDPQLPTVDVACEPALSATASDVLDADAILLLTPANIGYMSGALKHFFDTIYYPCMDATAGLPWGLVVHGNDNTAGAVRSVRTIADALSWRAFATPIEVTGPAGQLPAVTELGALGGAAALGLV